ncbi:hypothetical protein I4U23_029949 [Adineta vaga]|nr:hypothetical protein I4U23_029949 [Adineta vaga]
MSTTPKNDSNTTESSNTISEDDDVKMFQAARRTGRRNAMGDLNEQLTQVSATNSSSEVDNITPRLKTMSIQH